MGSTRGWILVAVAASSLLVAVESCAVDSFLMCGDACDDAGADGSSSADSAAGDGGLPPTCPTLDASCLGMPIPAGWSALAIDIGASETCPGATSDFGSRNYFTSPQLANGACQCTGCQVQGTWACQGVVSTSLFCDQNAETFDAGGCYRNVAGNVRLVVNRVGNVLCPAAQQIGSRDAGATAVTACVPTTCTADFCGLASRGYKTCIARADVADAAACPVGFVGSLVVGTAPIAECNNCQACALANADASCAGTLTPNSNGQCTGTPSTPITADGVCHAVPGGDNSASYDPDAAPIPSCGPSTGSTGGVAALASPITVCCTSGTEDSKLREKKRSLALARASKELASSIRSGGTSARAFFLPARGTPMTTRKAWLLSSLFAAGFFLVGTREAHAQERGFAVDKFNPSTRGSEWFSNDSLDLRGKVRPAFGLVLDYAYRPLTFLNAPPNDDIIAASIVRDQLFMHVGGSVVLFDTLRLGANLPIALENFGHPLNVGVVNFNQPQHEQGVGDLSVGADLRLLGKYGSPFTVALGAQVFLPTGSRDDYTSDGQVRFKPRLLAAGDIGAFVYAARFDFQYRGLNDDYGSVKLGSEIGGGVSAGLRVLDKHLVIGPELSASTLLSPTPANPNTGLGGDSASAAGTYLEGLLGTHVSVSDFRFGVGGGLGLTRGYGTPVGRGLLSIEWTPTVNEDKDGDGIKDDEDACPNVAGVRTQDPATNGCPPPPPPPPDRDGDGVLDSNDACPDTPGVPTSDPKTNGCPPDKDGDGIIDAQDACIDVAGVRTDDPKTNGCPPDSDGDGVLDPQDACPHEIGIKSDDPKLNGCPDPDRDKDGVTNDVDACPDEPGKPDPDPKKNGCPIAYVKDGEIKITQQVLFKTGSAAIAAGPDSEGVLNAVDEILLKHPEIKKVRVEGHTDNVGKAAANKTLSKNRAQSVVTWLTKHGIEKTRLYSVGFGQEKPIADNATAEGKAANRRVEFHIEEEGTAGSGNDKPAPDTAGAKPTSTKPAGNTPESTPKPTGPTQVAPPANKP